MEPPIDNAPKDMRDYEIWVRDEHVKALKKENEKLKYALDMYSDKHVEVDDKGVYVWSATNHNKCYLSDYLETL